MIRISIDVGGTFTDLIAFDESTGSSFNLKIPSIPRDPSEGVVKGLKTFLDGNIDKPIRMIGHATTIGTNALFGQIDLELKKTAFITTRGFRDLLEIGRQRRAEVYNLFFKRPPQLVERRHRYEVEERIDHRGRDLTPLNLKELDEALKDIQKEGIASVAIGFLNSYANPKHEMEAVERVANKSGKLYISASSGISNEYREYERFSTTVVNAVLMPVIDSYLSKLCSSLKEMEVGAPLFIMQSNGGFATTDVTSRKPSSIVESGPAAGVIASAWLGGILGEENIISFDMGGTTAKAGAIYKLKPEVVSEYEVAGKVHVGRLIKGSGYPVRLPFIDLAECSAGGGTIATVDEAGALKVGPLSAGAYPGPACYGYGNTQPTITDANLLLGRLNQRELLGGGMQIFPEYSKIAFKSLGEKIGVSPEYAAESVIQIANSMMAKILKIVSVERGFDPRKFTLMVFGGAGPMHACALAEDLQIRKIIIPPNPGMFSALGLLAADFFHDFVKGVMKTIDELEIDRIEKYFLKMEEEGGMILASEGIEQDRMRFLRMIDFRYLGQSYELTIDTEKPFSSNALNSAVLNFHSKHRDVYGYSMMSERVEVVSIRVRAIGEVPKPFLQKTSTIRQAPRKELRRVFFEDLKSWVETPVYDRDRLTPGFQINGPAIVEQYDSTSVIYPDWSGTVDGYCNLILEK
ncbi:MAG: hydantoinase/oxoprolinase family protein [Candidatus Bathyarchaeia archaeon]